MCLEPGCASWSSLSDLRLPRASPCSPAAQPVGTSTCPPWEAHFLQVSSLLSPGTKVSLSSYSPLRVPSIVPPGFYLEAVADSAEGAQSSLSTRAPSAPQRPHSDLLDGRSSPDLPALAGTRLHVSVHRSLMLGHLYCDRDAALARILVPFSSRPRPWACPQEPRFCKNPV